MPRFSSSALPVALIDTIPYSMETYVWPFIVNSHDHLHTLHVHAAAVCTAFTFSFLLFIIFMALLLHSSSVRALQARRPHYYPPLLRRILSPFLFLGSHSPLARYGRQVHRHNHPSTIRLLRWFLWMPCDVLPFLVPPVGISCWLRGIPLAAFFLAERHTSASRHVLYTYRSLYRALRA